LLDTALYYKEETFFHVVQADFTGRIYYAASVFNPQGNDLARALHRFAEGKPIKNEEAKNWLGIAGANNWGMSRCSYQERIEWANTEGAALARQIASSPEATVSLWSKAEEPFQFVSWCIEWSGMLDEGYGFISKHPVLLDGSNNGYQHFAAMTCDQELAGKVNLIKSDKIQDLYNEVKAELLLNLADSEDPLATDWLKYQEVITRKLVKKPIMMIPYSGTLYGISHAIEDYLYHQNLQLDWMTDDFEHNYFLAKKIVETVEKVCPKSSIIMQYLTDVAKCFGGESKIMKWNTPSKFYVNQNYYKLNSKRVKTKIGTSTVRLSLTDVSSEVDKRKTSISFASNFVHSLDAANVHLALHKSKQKGLTNFTTIHDCFGSTAADIQEFISCVKESFVEMYTDNLLDDLYDQAVEQLDKPQRLPIPPILGDFNICEVLLAPYVFS
jgi:DNA-directed RNA polymerase